MQTTAAKEAAAYVNNRYGTDISLAKFRYVFPDNFTLKEVHVQDEQQDTLIYAEHMEVGLDAFVANTAYSSGVRIDNLRFYWLKKKGEDEYNFMTFVRKFSTGAPTGDPFALRIAGVEINDARFRYEDLNCDSCIHFNIRDLNTEINAFALKGDEVSGDIESLSLKERDNIEILSFRSEVEYMKRHFSFRETEFETGESFFKGDVVMEYESPSDLSHFVERVKLVADVEESDLSSQEVQFFAEAFPDFKQFRFMGEVEGLVNDLSGESLEVELGTETRFTGNLRIRNSMYPDSLFLNASQVQMRTNIADIRYVYGLFTDSALPAIIDPFGSISLTGGFNGNLQDFHTDVYVSTDIGDLRADLLMVIPPEQGMISYRGAVQVEGFHLGRFLEDTALGKVSTSLNIDGRGFDPVKMNTSLAGKVTSFEYNNYEYSQIDVDGRIRKSLFNGKLHIDDPNLQFSFEGSASFGKDTSRYDFVAEILKADLYALNLTQDTISSLTATMNIDLQALNYDRWAGDIKVTNLTYENPRNFHFFEDITLRAEGLRDDRFLEIDSRLLSAELRGDYTLEGMWQIAQFHASKFLKGVKRVSPPRDQNFKFEIDINNTRVLTEIFAPELDIEPGSHLRGSYSSDNNTFVFDVNSPGFQYDKNQIRNIDLEFEGGPEKSELAFFVGRYTLPSGVRIDSITLGNYYYRDTLNYDLSWVMRDSIDSRGNLHGYAIQQDTNIFKTGIYRSGFNIGHDDLIVHGGNQIVIDTGGFHIQNFEISNEGRSLTVNGNISNSPNEILRINLRGFDVDLVNYFIGSQAARFNGELYGDVILTQLLGSPKFAADLHVDSLEMNSILLGTLDINSDWTVENDTIRLNTSLVLGDLTTFEGTGYYQPDSLGTIFLDLDFERFRLAAFNPLVEGIAENLRGYVSGGVKVRGNTGAPLVTGELTLPSTAFTISFLHTDYNVVGEPVVKLLEDRIAFPDMTLRDTRFGTEGTLSGNIIHSNFRDFDLDLRVEAEELLVLNTSARTEDPYYGTAFVNGKISLGGPLDQLKLSADLSTRRNTKFYIPISGATEVRKSDFVTFINPQATDSAMVENQSPMHIDKGISLDFNLNVNRYAEVGIIIDEDGNEMRATGSGNLRVRINPYSDLEIYGTYTVAEGHYNFVLQDALQRRFEILRGGTVTWNGDPFGALIDLTARYSTRANPADLIEGYRGGQTLVYVDLLISGELMNPDINFNVTAPRAAGNVQSVLASRFADVDTRYEQVFALLTLGRFWDNQNAVAGQAARQDAGLKFLAGQAETYLNRFTGDYNVTLNYQATSITEEDAGVPADGGHYYQEEVQVGVSKDFLDDRVTVNGVVGVPVGVNRDPNQIAGDFQVEYDITPDGRFRATAFTRPVQQYSFGQQNYQQGVGLFYSIDFETWGDLFHKVFLYKKKEEATREEEGDSEDEPDEDPSEDPGLPEEDLPEASQ